MREREWPPDHNFRAVSPPGKWRLLLEGAADPLLSCLVSKNDLRDRAERRFAHALRESGARDPRDFYRERLRELRERDPAAFDEAVEYYEKTLIPAVADDASEPLAEWLEYGRLLARLLVDGETLQIDPTGRSGPYRAPVPRDHLVIQMPGSPREKALPVGLPPELSPAQRAAYDLLVRHATG